MFTGYHLPQIHNLSFFTIYQQAQFTYVIKERIKKLEEEELNHNKKMKGMIYENICNDKDEDEDEEEEEKEEEDPAIINILNNYKCHKTSKERKRERRTQQQEEEFNADWQKRDGKRIV